MSLNAVPSGERVHIGFFGCRNAGKSSLVNAVTGQSLSIVSEVKGTTTDPVTKAMERLPLGPVVIIDTPGFDDEGYLGEMRVKKTREILGRSDMAVLVVDASRGMTAEDGQLLQLMKERGLPYLIALNKSDLISGGPSAGSFPEPDRCAAVSAVTGEGIEAFKERLAAIVPQGEERHLAADLVCPGDAVILVCPIDESAPKGRLILPQQQAVRDLMERGALPVVVRETELRTALDALKNPPALVITDSHAFGVVSRIVPGDIPLTSFSILMARYKGFLETAVRGVSAIAGIGDGDRILLAEGCTHHRQCNDIGTVKIPRWLRQMCGGEPVIETCSGREFPDDLTPYRVVIHCGGCMRTERAVTERMERAEAQGVPFTNYGLAIAQMTGTLERSLRIFPDLHAVIAGGGT